MKRSVAKLISKRDETADEVDPKPPCNDTGNAFGGRASKFKVISDSHLPLVQPIYSFSSVTRHEVSLFAQGPSRRSRHLSRILSSVRRPAASKPNRKTMSLPTEGHIELDSHTDTIVMGANCVILSHRGQSFEVMPYSDTYDTITDVLVITGATLWTSPHDGEEFILIFNEALWMGNTLQHALVNPNQL